MRETNPTATEREAGERAADLVKEIAGYIDHLQDAAHVSRVVSGAPMAELGRVLVHMLRSGERAAAGNAALFVQDAVMFGLSPTFARYFARSRVLRALRHNVVAADYFTRHQSIRTLGRLGPRSNTQYFAEAFPWYLEHDPFNLGDLFGELFWLSPRAAREPYLEALTTSPLYLARWAVLGHLLDHGTCWSSGWTDPPARVLGYVQRLTEERASVGARRSCVAAQSDGVRRCAGRPRNNRDGEPW